MNWFKKNGNGIKNNTLKLTTKIFIILYSIWIMNIVDEITIFNYEKTSFRK